MKLSEAILLGIGSVKNNRLLFFAKGNDGPCGCALGTAFYAVGESDNYRKNVRDCSATNFCEKLWPWTRKSIQSTIFSHISTTISEEISRRHFHGESRESIARWIASIEPQDQPTEEVHNEAVRSHLVG